jgi:hypothetical protein
MDIGGEMAGRIEAPLTDGLPDLLVEDLGIQLQFPDHLQRLPLSVVVEAGHPDKRTPPGFRLYSFDQVGARADPNNLAWDR